MLLWLVTAALAHDYILQSGPPTPAGVPIHGVVANAEEREIRRARPDTLTRLDGVDASGATALPPILGAWGMAPVTTSTLAVVYENAGAEITLPWAKFRTYVHTEGDPRLADVIDALPKEPQREHYRRSLKLLQGVGPGREGWDRVVGLPLEIVPVDRPGSREQMRVRLLASGEPVVGARVRAYPFAGHADDDAVTARTNEEGVATLALPDRSLDWVYAAVVMSHDAERAHPWHSVWTTLRTR